MRTSSSLKALVWLVGASFSLLPVASEAQRRVPIVEKRVQIGEKIVSLDGYGFEKGQPTAPVWIVELADFGCSYCAKFAKETMPALDSAFTKPGKVYWRFVPFVLGMFPNAQEAAEGSVCAAAQGRFWQMHDGLYERRKEWMGAKDAKAVVARIAASAGVEPAAFGKCLKGGSATAVVARNNALAKSMYVRGTPTFVINGELVQGALPQEVFMKGLEAVHKAVTAPGR